jgi:hypothetical protein
MKAIEKEEMKTMVSCLNSLLSKGYEAQFKVTAAGLESLSTGKSYKPEEIRIPNFYRFEGESDPADNSILYAIETVDGEKGTLTDAYGPYNDAKVTRFIQQVEEVQKKVQKEKPL